MKQCWSTSELAESWTLSDDEKQLSDQRTQQGRLGLALLLKFSRSKADSLTKGTSPDSCRVDDWRGGGRR